MGFRQPYAITHSIHTKFTEHPRRFAIDDVDHDSASIPNNTVSIDKKPDVLDQEFFSRHFMKIEMYNVSLHENREFGFVNDKNIGKNDLKHTNRTISHQTQFLIIFSILKKINSKVDIF